MAFTYTLGLTNPGEINPRELRHRYFVQLAPDKEHVVPGSLLQGTRPPIGQWLELGTIRRKLAARYFVQQTSINTLVPGLLVQNDLAPGPNWKDIQSNAMFHIIEFDDVPYTVTENYVEAIITYGEEFLGGIVNPALDAVYPNRNPADPIRLRLYHYMDGYTQLNNDPSLLTLFTNNEVATGIGYYLPGTGYISEINSTDTDLAELIVQPDADYGYFSFVLAVLNENDEVMDYIFLNNVFNHFLPG